MSESSPVNRAIKAWCGGDEYTLNKVTNVRIISECVGHFIRSRTRVSQTVCDAAQELMDIRYSYKAISDLWFVATKVVVLMLVETLDGPFIKGESITYDNGKVKVLLERIETEKGPVYSIGSYREDVSECIYEYHPSLYFRFLQGIQWRCRQTARPSIYGYPDPEQCFQEQW